MIEPNKALLEDPEIPTIELHGRRWPVPKLAIEQLRIVGPIIVARRHVRITTEAIDDLATLVYWALRRGHPELTREAFDDMPLDLPGLVDAFSIVARQAGIFQAAKAEGNGVARPLAAAPTAPETSPTGTP